jgi:cysteine desulfurase
MARAAELQARLWHSIERNLEFVRLNGPRPGTRRLATNLHVSFEFVEGEGLALFLDTRGIAVASGPACVTKSMKISPVLTAIGLDRALAQGNLLFSLGRENTAEEIDYTVETLTKAVERLRGLSPSWDEFQRGAVDSLIRPRAAKP